MVWDETVIGWNRFWTKMSKLDESVLWKCFWMSFFFLQFGWKWQYVWTLDSSLRRKPLSTRLGINWNVQLFFKFTSTCPSQACRVFWVPNPTTSWSRSPSIYSQSFLSGTWSNSCWHTLNCISHVPFASIHQNTHSCLCPILLHICQELRAIFCHNLGILTLPWRKHRLKKNSPLWTSPDLPTQPSRAHRPQPIRGCHGFPWFLRRALVLPHWLPTLWPCLPNTLLGAPHCHAST